MSDNYQAVYDAARSRISPTSSSDVSNAARDAFDISYARAILQQEIYAVAYELRRPSTVYRPAISIDGNQWCALYGANIQDGVAGFGDSPSLAMDAFDAAWFQKLASKAQPPAAEEPKS